VASFRAAHRKILVYQVGSSEQYRAKFHSSYRDWLGWAVITEENSL